MTQEELKKHREKQNIISAVILIVGILGALIIFGGNNKSSEEKAVDKPEEPAKAVKALKLEKGVENAAELKKTLFLNSSNDGMAVAEYAGRIKEINFKVGDFVKEGQVLAIFDQASNVNSVKASLETAQNSYNLALKNLKDTKKITQESLDLADDSVDIAELKLEQAKDGGNEDAIDLAEENLDVAKTQEDQAEASAEVQINSVEIQLEQARAGLEQARIAYEKSFIRSPVSGYAVSKEIGLDDYVNLGQKIAEIVGEGKLEGKVFLNKNEVSRVKTGDAVSIKIGEKNYEGRLDSISEIANQANQRFEAKIEVARGITNSANQNAQAVFKLRIANQDSFFVPLDAINIGQTMTRVFKIKNGVAKAVEVEMGEIIGNQVEIIQGLEEGDQVIIDGNRNLREGMKVKIIEEKL